MKYFALICVLALAVACGSKTTPDYISTAPGGGATSFGGALGHAGRSGTAGTGGSGTSAEAGEGGESGATDGSSLAPTVEITAPVGVSDPTSGTVLTADAVTVTCSVTASKESGVAVLVSSVKIQMLGADGAQIGTDGSVMSGDNANEYTARFVLAGVVPTGQVSFICSASDQSAAPLTSTATVQTFYDGGPTITLANPMDKSAHPLGAILFQFSALPTALATDDADAAVDNVTLSVNGINITTITPVTGMPGYYQSDLNLSDPTIFTPKPVGSVSVVITATNKRGTTATNNYSFVVDSTGPTITIVSPPTTSVQFIGGETVITFTVVDEAGGSGVDTKSVQATVNTTAPSSYMEGSDWHSADGKTFSYSFNTRDYPGQLGASVTISAFDLAGNQAQDATAFYYLDNVPPILDLQPPVLQEREKSGTSLYCGEPFAPLGERKDNLQNAPVDLQTIPSVNTFRALLWDEGNLVDGQGVSFFSDIDTSAGVRLYFQQDTSKPFLQNDQGTAGGVCNQVADITLPSIPLTPLAPAGTSFYDHGAPEPSGSSCVPGTDTALGLSLCNDYSPLWRVIQHETATAGGGLPVIYAFQADNGALCTGGQFDVTTKVTSDGWLCVAVVAQDKVGNIAVSAPLRLCLDAEDSAGAGFVGTPACAAADAIPPTCVAAAPAGCVPPPHFGKTLIDKP